MNVIRYLFLVLFPMILGGIILLLVKLVEAFPSKVPAALITIIIAILLLFAWYKIGQSFAQNIKDLRVAVLLGNGLPILLTILYIWQTVFTAYEDANGFIVRVAQLYFAPLFVSLQMAVLPLGSKAVFAVQKPPISVIAQIVFLVFFIWIFSRGYLSVHSHCTRRSNYRR